MSADNVDAVASLQAMIDEITSLRSTVSELKNQLKNQGAFINALSATAVELEKERDGLLQNVKALRGVPLEQRDDTVRMRKEYIDRLNSIITHLRSEIFVLKNKQPTVLEFPTCSVHIRVEEH